MFTKARKLSSLKETVTARTANNEDGDQPATKNPEEGQIDSSEQLELCGKVEEDWEVSTPAAAFFTETLLQSSTTNGGHPTTNWDI